MILRRIPQSRRFAFSQCFAVMTWLANSGQAAVLRYILCSVLCFLFAFPAHVMSSPAVAPGPSWRDWNADLFKIAAKEKKYVIVDLEAVWCHWCHVMEARTYSDPQVRRMLANYFIAVKVNQDTRPDLSNRYGDYGWPATIIFDERGREIDIEQGYIPPSRMISLLKMTVRGAKQMHPSLEALAVNASVTSNSVLLSKADRQELTNKHRNGYDTEHGGWGTEQKFLDWANVEFAISEAIGGNKLEGERAQATLKNELNLLDPVWGGVYQYSTHSDWSHPHFEKIMRTQTENIRIYCLAYLTWHDEAYLKAASSIATYMNAFLKSADGSFYASQDADVHPGLNSAGYYKLDDSSRRKIGLPAVDRNVYARENGWAIQSFAKLYGVTARKEYLDDALKAVCVIEKSYLLPYRGFRHVVASRNALYLSDTLSMGRAYLSLYEVTADRVWLSKAEQCGDYISAHFSNNKSRLGAGFRTATSDSSICDLDENIDAARFFNLLNHYSLRKQDRSAATQAMRLVVSPRSVHSRNVMVGGILLSDHENTVDPYHLVTVGARKDARASELFKTSLLYPSDYRQVEWFDPTDKLVADKVSTYPHRTEGSTYICGTNSCSAPISEKDELLIKMRSALKL